MTAAAEGKLAQVKALLSQQAHVETVNYQVKKRILSCAEVPEALAE